MIDGAEDSERGWFEGKVALVTGATRGIGWAITHRLASRGVSVVLNGRNPETLDEAVRQIRVSGGRARGMQGSISDPEFPQRFVAEAVDDFGRVDFVVNNAATSAWFGRLIEADRDAFVKTMIANTWPAIAIVQKAIAAGMTGGAVVNISTTGAQRVHSLTGPYTASKAALESLTATLARELGPRDITVNAIAPGLVRTDLARALWEGEREKEESRLVPMQRLGTPDDIASAAVYLLGPHARWVSGTILRVDGGRFHVGGESADMIGVY